MHDPASTPRRCHRHSPPWWTTAAPTGTPGRHRRPAPGSYRDRLIRAFGLALFAGGAAIVAVTLLVAAVAA